MGHVFSLQAIATCEQQGHEFAWVQTWHDVGFDECRRCGLAALMVERGRVLKTSAYVESLGAVPLKKGQPVDDAEERAKRFRNGSRAHRLRLLREAIPTRKEAQG